MKRTKKSERIKQPPFNINISFNINPKNVHQSQNHTSIKMPQTNTQQISQKNNLKGNVNKNITNYPPSINVPTTNIQNRPISQYMPQEIQQKKQLQQLKKNFMAKINNFDIVLPLNTNQEMHEIEENVQKSSIMSERMEKFQAQQNTTSDLKQPQQFNLNIQSFQPSKSKILTNNAFSKAYNMENKKKDKFLPSKHSLSQVKQQSKWLTHQKGQSCFTDRKYIDRSSKRKKANKKEGKQENLKQKLQRFKVDLMKLALVYQQTQVLKTKMSSEYHNVRSREISKENVMKMSEGQDNQHLQEIRHYQASKNQQSKSYQKKQSDLLSKIKNQVNQSLDQLISEAEESQSFANFKYIYKGLQRQTGKQDENLCTYSIIDLYKNLSEEVIQESEVRIQQYKQQKQESQHNKSDKLQVYEQEVNQQKQKDLDKNGKNKQMVDLTGFLQFTRSKLGEEKGIQFKQIIQTLFSQYMQQTLSPSHKLKGNMQQKQIQIEEVDESIDKQLNIIPSLRSQLISELEIKPENADDLQFWEQNYKEQLLRIKGKMWKQYYNIKNEVQSRINSGNQSKVIKTKKQKKMGKIMKCLSEKMINKAYVNNLKIYSQIENKQTHEGDNNLLKLKEVPVQQQKLEDYRQRDEYLKVQMSQEEVSQEEQFHVPLSFQNYEPKANILIEQKQIPRENQNLMIPHITDDDKQDIYQFIFLDLCIQLYQNYVEKQSKVETGGQINAAQRILNRIKQHISEQKQKKKDQSSKKIGISTNINTVRNILTQLINFLSEETFFQTINTKLNSPLGPSQVQILKSLRLPAFDQNHPDQDMEPVEEDDLLVLEPNWFIRFQNQVIHIQQLQFCKYYDSPQRDQQRINYLRNCTHIHHKAIYDCLNQHLDYSRVYGLWGKPFSWKIKSQFNHIIDEKHTKVRFVAIQSALKKAQSQVLRCCMFACGLMLNKQQSLIKDIANDVQYVRRLQDERVYKLLQNFVGDMQQKWFFHDDEQAQILIEVSHIVWTILIKEVIKDMTTIQML